MNDELGDFESELEAADEQTEPTNPDGIKIGDVALDLAQGRPVHIIDEYDGTAAEWSEENDYEITENYANGRLGSTDSDAVFEVVYCSNAKSEPNKSYAMPVSRLLRIETEAADDGMQVYDRVALDLLDRLFQAAHSDDENTVNILTWMAEEAGVDELLIEQADELAEAATLGNLDGQE